MKDPTAAPQVFMIASVGLAILGGISEAASGQEAVSEAPLKSTWTIPSNEGIKKLLADRLQRTGAGVVVGVIEPAGKRVVTYGSSGAKDGRPLDGDTVFQLGSVTKVFTALLLADMVQRGEVKLDDPASKYLPTGVRMPQRGRPITLLDLATHRSGLPSMPTNFDLEAQPNPIEAYSLDDLYEFLGSYTPDSEPGEKGAYSNVGVALLGRLLAQRAGMDYEALLKVRVLGPLGMHSSSITLSEDQGSRLAPGHDRYQRPVDTWEMKTLQGSGSLRSTANDMLLFLSASLGYLDTPLKAALEYQRTTRSPMNADRALAWGVGAVGTEEYFGHEGGKAGYRAAVILSPKLRTGVVVLMNARTDDRPSGLAMHLLFGEPLPDIPVLPPARQIVTLNPELLNKYAGQYRLESGKLVTILNRGNHLFIDVGRSGMIDAYPFSESEFFFNTEPGGVNFEVDGSGQAVELRLFSDDLLQGDFKAASRIKVPQ